MDCATALLVTISIFVGLTILFLCIYCRWHEGIARLLNNRQRFGDTRPSARARDNSSVSNNAGSETGGMEGQDLAPEGG